LKVLSLNTSSVKGIYGKRLFQDVMGARDGRTKYLVMFTFGIPGHYFTGNHIQ
jgi:hypothetical protein